MQCKYHGEMSVEDEHIVSTEYEYYVMVWSAVRILSICHWLEIASTLEGMNWSYPAVKRISMLCCYEHIMVNLSGELLLIDQKVHKYVENNLYTRIHVHSATLIIQHHYWCIYNSPL